jgi:hypothetical protein
MGYAEAIELQVALAEHYRSPAAVPRFLGRARATPHAWNEGEVGEAVGSVRAMIDVAEPYAVAGPICELIAGATHAGLAGVRMVPDLLPSTNGLVVFERPLPLPAREDPDGAVQRPLWMIGWMPYRVEEGREVMGFAAGRLVDFAGVVFAFFFRQPDDPLPQIMFLNRVRWGETLEDSRGWRSQVSEAGKPRLRQSYAHFQCLLHFLQERILASRARAVTNRGARRRLRKAVGHEPLVRVVELRRRDVRRVVSGDAGDDAVEWSCRWLVRGHWHLYHTREGVRPRWVDPYVKGPDDKPFKAPRATVYEVVR